MTAPVVGGDMRLQAQGSHPWPQAERLLAALPSVPEHRWMLFRGALLAAVMIEADKPKGRRVRWPDHFYEDALSIWLDHQAEKRGVIP